MESCSNFFSLIPAIGRLIKVAPQHIILLSADIEKQPGKVILLNNVWLLKNSDKKNPEKALKTLDNNIKLGWCNLVCFLVP